MEKLAEYEEYLGSLEEKLEKVQGEVKVLVKD